MSEPKINFQKLSLRSANILKRNNILTYSQLENLSSVGLGTLKGAGEEFVKEINSFMSNNRQYSTTELDLSDLSVRSQTILNNRNITNVKELSVFFYSGKIREEKNAGVKVYEEIKTYLKNYSEDYRPILLDMDFYDIFPVKDDEIRFLEQLNITTLRDFLSLDVEKLERLKCFKKLTDYVPDKLLNSHINFAKKTLYFIDIWELALADTFSDESRKEIFTDRILHGCTLDECGKKMGITRERVRQFETRFIKNLEPFLISIFPKIKDEVEVKALTSIMDLEITIKELKGISSLVFNSQKPKAFYNFLFRGTSKYFSYELIDEEINIFRSDALSKQELHKEFEKYALDIKNYGISLEKLFHGFCILHNRTDLENTFLDFMLDLMSRSKVRFIEMTLKDYRFQKKVIALDEYTNYLNSLYPNNKIDTRRIENAIAHEIEGVYLITRRNYIFYDDLPFTQTQINSINDEAVLIITENPTRSYSLENAIKPIQIKLHENHEFSEDEINQLTPGILNILLSHRSKSHQDINYLGRLQWTSGKQKQRVELYPAAVKALEDNGSPMTNLELRKKIHKVRGVHQFQLHTTKTSPDIIKLENGTWGLRFRDINLSEKIEADLIEKIKEFLKSDNLYILQNNLDEIRDELNIDSKITNELLLNIIRRHIPSGGRRGNPDFLMNKSNQSNFIIYHPSLEDDEVQKIYSSTKHLFWDIYRINIFLLDQGIFSSEEFDRYMELGNKNSEYFPRSSRYLEHYYGFIGFENLLYLKDNPEKKEQFISSPASSGGRNPNFWSIQEVESFFVKNEITSSRIYLEWRSLNLPEKQFLPSHVVLYKSNFCGFKEIQKRVGKEVFSDASEWWDIKKIEKFFIDNSIYSRKKFFEWRKLNKEEKKYIPSHEVLEDIGFCGYAEIKSKLGIKDKRSKNFWSMQRIEDFFVEQKIVDGPTFLEWRRKNLPEKKFIPANRALFERGFAGWRVVRERLGIYSSYGSRKHLWSIEKIEAFFITNQILSDNDFRAWRRKNYPEKKYIPGNTMLYRMNFSGWKKIKEVFNEKNS